MRRKLLLLLSMLVSITVSGCDTNIPDLIEQTTSIIDIEYKNKQGILEQTESNVSLSDIPVYSGDAVAIVNNNNPQFNELTTESYEYYSELDYLGRCGVAQACLGVDLMPTEEREPISHIKPSGWQNKEYDTVDGGYLYNRCHLIGFQLAGENANEKNLITGTRYMNTPIMTNYENAIAQYIKETGNHVMYRVTPLYDGEDLLAKGLLMEGYSVEDNGEGVCFNVFVYNEQPNITIDHSTGENWLGSDYEVIEAVVEEEEARYVLNTNSMKIHDISCNSVARISDANKTNTKDNVEELESKGFQRCGSCNPN